MRTKAVLFFLLLLPVYVVNGQDDKREYLKKVLNNLEQIKSATYKVEGEVWNPGDTIPSSIRKYIVKEFDDPADSTIGASFVNLGTDDGKEFQFGYNGEVRVLVNHAVKEIKIDNFTTRPLPFRPLTPPFFNYCKNIVRYALETEDSIVTTLEDCGDYFHFKLVINEDTQVEFFGKACYMPQNPYIYDPTSIYKIWISKENDMPYRYRREMQHSISEDICSDFVYNPSGKGKIVAEDYYPADYVRRIKGEKSQKATVDMTGKKAPDWTLTDMKGQKVSLSGIKSKVILLQFTGIGCGPCKISIPFLNSLRKEYAVNELEVLAVETWGRSKSSCEAYVKNQGIEYSFLTADKDTIAKLINDYQAGSGVPQFYLIGKDRTIIAKFQGYAEKTTDAEIEKKIKANL